MLPFVKKTNTNTKQLNMVSSVKEITLFRKPVGRLDCKARREETNSQDELAGLHSYIIPFYSVPLPLTVKGHFTHNSFPTEFSIVSSIHNVWCKITGVL